MSDSFATPWTVALQAPLSMGFPKQEYWSGSPFLSPGDFPEAGIKPESLALTGRFFTTVPPENVWLPGASVRNSAHGKGHEEGGLAYAKA